MLARRSLRQLLDLLKSGTTLIDGDDQHSIKRFALFGTQPPEHALKGFAVRLRLDMFRQALQS
jgi:hypothetical protein